MSAGQVTSGGVVSWLGNHRAEKVLFPARFVHTCVQNVLFPAVSVTFQTRVSTNDRSGQVTLFVTVLTISSVSRLSASQLSWMIGTVKPQPSPYSRFSFCPQL